MKKSVLKLDSKMIDAFYLDFDGVLTNNKFYLSQNGFEMVKLSRSDGLAFDYLRQIKIPTFIISSEKNPIIKKRAQKLKINSYNSVSNKLLKIQQISKKYNYKLSKSIFVGNDINDYSAMEACGYTFCPNDSHPIIKKISSYVIRSNGGDGVIRNIVENYFKLNIKDVLY